MIYNLLNSLTDPDNVADGYAKADMRPIYTLAITVIAIIVIIIAAIIIYNLYKHSKNEEITKNKWIPYAILIITIILTILLIILCCFAVKE